MKITGVETRPCGPQNNGSLLVLLHTDSDCMGLGEVACHNQPRTIDAAIEEIRNSVLGADPFNLNALNAKLSTASHYTHDGVLRSVTTAIETACLDAVGKQLGVPVSQLFGGALREELRLCATGWACEADAPAEFAHKAGNVVASGFTAIKCNPFGLGDAYLSAAELDRAVEVLRSIREAIGPESGLIVDANRRFTPAEAARVAKAIEPFHVMYLENPIQADDPDSLEIVGGTIAVPIAVAHRAAAPHAFRELIERQLSDFVPIDCSGAGGVLRARQFALLAESYFVPVCLSHVGGAVSLAMNAHIAACAPNFHLAEFHYPLLASWEAASTAPLELRNGSLRVPSAPGLGVDLQVGNVRRPELVTHA